jgi:hypothetical protein
MAFHTYHDVAMPDPECIANLKPKLKMDVKKSA